MALYSKHEAYERITDVFLVLFFLYIIQNIIIILINNIGRYILDFELPVGMLET